MITEWEPLFDIDPDFKYDSPKEGETRRVKVDAIRYYEVGSGDNLTKLQAPCILYIYNCSAWFWYDGWSPLEPGWTNRIPDEIGKYFKQIQESYENQSS